MPRFFALYHQIVILLILTLLLQACAEEKTYLFKTLSPSASGIDFNNSIEETDSLNILNFHYIYNGGGVGVGDFNQDGLPDLVFSGNQVPSKLYLNTGGLKFAEVSKAAFFQTQAWATGVSIIDINADGRDDIYLSVGGYACEGQCKNQLFINQGLSEEGIPQFEEMAALYGLDNGFYTQQAMFFDYDLDGDLDVYLLQNAIDKRDKNAPSAQHFINKKSKDIFLENPGTPPFFDRSEELGIKHRGYGLGIAIDDFDANGWPDIYVANDFLSDDALYLNQGAAAKKGFKEISKQVLKHTSYNAMGIDIADVNQDNLPDIFVLDMLPAYNERQKTMLGFMNYNKFQLSLRQGYMPQFIRNTLQVHNGFLNDDLIPFSEVAYFSGIAMTDWSWTPLLADLDNDGDRDLFVTNGYGKDITDLDFINYTKHRNPFGNKATQQKELFEAVLEMEANALPNYLFENTGDLHFKDQSGEWMNKENSISNGAVYADLDRDGDLDLVVNNLNAPASILENQTDTKNTANHYLKIQLKGANKNTSAIGTKIKLWLGGIQQTYFHAPVRGYLSSNDPLIHFGLGKHTVVDSIEVNWSTGGQQKLKSIEANQILRIQEELGAPKATISSQNLKTLIQPVAVTGLDNFKHKENFFQDFDAQHLLLHQYSRQGPCLHAANVDGQAGEELFVGGAKGIAAQLFKSNASGTYKAIELPDKMHEDTDATFFDFDNDGDLDLYVVSGGTEFGPESTEYLDRLYINTGQGAFGKFVKDSFLPRSSGSCVRPCDFDQDGDIDLFVGSKLIPQQFPRIPDSYLLLNEGGKFVNYQEAKGVNFQKIGLVSDALWSDYDKDGWLDLIVVGEWMPITIFKNNNGKIDQDQKIEIPNSSGLWNCITGVDLDKDGYEDYLIGNLGLNSRLQATPTQPISLFTKDYDQNGSPDPLIGQYFPDQSGYWRNYPLHSRDDVMKQLVKLKNRYIRYSDFAQATLPELLGEAFQSDNVVECTNLSSSLLKNDNGIAFELHKLPEAAQFGPVQAIMVKDIDQDSWMDVLLVGNDFTSEKNNGWYDALNGLCLKGNEKGTFESLAAGKSGFFVPGDGRTIVELQTPAGQEVLVVGQNTGELKLFQISKKKNLNL